MKIGSFILFLLLSFSTDKQALAFAKEAKSPVSQAKLWENPVATAGVKELSSPATKAKASASQTKVPENQATDSQKSVDSPADSPSEAENPDKKPVVSRKIKEVFQDFINILETEAVQSPEYTKAVNFLERTLYNQADFETLKQLSQVYEQKKDFQNQKNVLEVLSLSESGASNPESFYLLAGAYKHLLDEAEEKDLSEKSEEYKEKVFENYKQALKRDPKHKPSYLAFLELLKVTDPETQEKKHSPDSLSLVLAMLKNLKDKKYYGLLCKAYYDNRFLKQARRACFKSVKKNPEDPVGFLMLSLSLSDRKKREEKLILTAKKFPESFLVQYHTGLYFRDRSSSSAISYLTQAQKLQPDHLRLNQILAQVLMENKNFASSYDYYLKACLLSEGAFLPELRKARGIVLRNNEGEIVLKFDQAIKECFQKAREKKRQKAQSKKAKEKKAKESQKASPKG